MLTAAIIKCDCHRNKHRKLNENYECFNQLIHAELTFRLIRCILWTQKVAYYHIQSTKYILNKLLFYHFAIIILEKGGLHLLNLVDWIISIYVNRLI